MIGSSRVRCHAVSQSGVVMPAGGKIKSHRGTQAQPLHGRWPLSLSLYYTPGSRLMLKSMSFHPISPWPQEGTIIIIPFVKCRLCSSEIQDFVLGHSTVSGKDRITQLPGFLSFLKPDSTSIATCCLSRSFCFLLLSLERGRCRREGCIRKAIDSCVHLLEKSLKKQCFCPAPILELPVYRSGYTDPLYTWVWGQGQSLQISRQRNMVEAILWEKSMT